MALDVKRLIGPVQLAASAATLYTVASGKRVNLRDIHISNGDTVTRTFTLSIGTDAASKRIFDTMTIEAGHTLQRTGAMVLEATEILQGFADAASKVVIIVNGTIEDV